MARRGGWKLTPNTKIWTECRKHMDILRGGTMLCLDPSCGSASSMPGYALYSAGELVDSGIIEVSGIHRDLPYRLQDIARVLREDFPRPDVLVIEEIPVRRFGGGSATAHASLLKAAGLMMGTVEAPLVIRVRPQVWRALRPDTWKKGDEQDAIALGYAVLQVCNYVDEARAAGRSARTAGAEEEDSDSD